MTDVNLPTKPATVNAAGVPQPGALLRARKERAADPAELVAMVELLFFAYRDFTAEPDAILAQLGFGRAHHRVLHFVNRNPGLRVADLLEVLKITKQSLGRVLKELVGQGYVVQTAGENDRRERRLNLTESGRQLAKRLLDIQTRRIEAALAAAGNDSERVARSFLLAVIADADRAEVKRLVGGGASTRQTDIGQSTEGDDR